MKFLWIILAVIILGLIGASVYLGANRTSTVNNQINEGQLSEQQQSASQSNDNIPASEVIKHNSQEDCWIVYKGKVYDVTPYLTKHPGGIEAIAPHCGKTGNEFKNAFEGKHGTSKIDLLFKVATHKGNLS